MDRLLRRPEVEALTGLSRSCIYSHMKHRQFPRPRRIGRQAVAWLESEIAAWIMSRKLAGPDPEDSVSTSRSVTRVICPNEGRPAS